MPWQRPDGRQPNEIRPVSFQRGYTKYAAGSVLACCGETKVLCTVSVEESVPRWLKDSGQGWLTAEYRMLPGATSDRNRRETFKLSGRTQEIQRLIGRSLRAAIDLEALGEFTLLVDADVIQADGGTRTTSITGSYVALVDALNSLKSRGLIEALPIKQAIAAISVGLIEDQSFVDLNYPEDFAADVDMNVVMTGNLDLIEVQGTAEANQFSRNQLNDLLDGAELGVKALLAAQTASLESPLP
ncbi:MAG: ribonuclease PH [Cyanobacteria bacterium P01_F01_bin.153]